MSKSTKRLPAPKNFMHFPGKRTSFSDPNFEVKDQGEPTDKDPIKRRHAMAGHTGIKGIK